jgi:allantoinase
MEHGRFEYSPIARRPKWRLPDEARVAVWVTPNIEHFHYDKPAMSMTPMTAGLRPDVLNYGWRDYGVRVGIWRLMEVLERQGFVATAALNSEGENNSSLFTGMSEDAERKTIKNVLETIARGTGQKPRGWLGPALTETDNTLDLLAEAGIDYVADWCNDEQPYAIRTRNGSIVAIPYTLEIGDIPVFLQHGGSGETFERMIVDQFDTMYEDGATQPRVLSIALHPFLTGHPFRARYLERALAHIRKHDAVWITTGSAIVDWYKSNAS